MPGPMVGCADAPEFPGAGLPTPSGLREQLDAPRRGRRRRHSFGPWGRGDGHGCARPPGHRRPDDWHRKFWPYRQVAVRGTVGRCGAGRTDGHDLARGRCHGRRRGGTPHSWQGRSHVPTGHADWHMVQERYARWLPSAHGREAGSAVAEANRQTWPRLQRMLSAPTPAGAPDCAHAQPVVSAFEPAVKPAGTTAGRSAGKAKRGGTVVGQSG